MGAFLASFTEYVVELLFLAIVALLGVKTGKKLRENKNAKAQAIVEIKSGKR